MILSAAAVISFADEFSPFSDVQTVRWSYNAIKYAYEQGYMNGVAEGVFDPAGTVNRAMVVTVLYRREGSPECTPSSSFNDVKDGEWYSDAVSWAEENGIVNGTSKTTFSPKGIITREQLYTMLCRYTSFKGLDTGTGYFSLSSFKDSTKVSEYAEKALIWAVRFELIQGMEKNGDLYIEPKGNATREQFATILQRFDGTDLSLPLKYNDPVLQSSYTETDYPLVTDADFYVSPSGDDTADGSFEAPFATFGRAAEAVRESDRTQRSDITVAFMAGEYTGTHVDMAQEHSGTKKCPVIYCAYGDGDVVFNNGIDIKSDEFLPLSAEEGAMFSDKAKDSIKKYDISDLLDDGTDKDGLLLFCDEGLCMTARFPNKTINTADVFIEACADTYDETSLIVTHTILKRRLAKYSAETISDAKIYGYIVRGYRKDTFDLESYDEQTGILKIANYMDSEFGRMRPDWNDINMFVLDIPDELDYSGEYWIDGSTGILYVYDPQGTYHIPVSDDIVTMDGTDNVTFSGLSFRNTTGSFIKASDSHGVTIDRCDFNSCSSERGVSFEGCSSDRPMDLSITASEFANAYGHSVYVDGGCDGQYRYTRRSDIVFDNNLVMTSNLVYDVENAVTMRYCSGLTVTHNRFENSSRGAFSFSHSYDVLIEYNDFDSVMKNSQDGGALYSDSMVDGRNIVVRYNLFNEMPSAGTGTFGYYVDDYTAGTDIHHNIFYNASCPVMIHKGRDNYVHDNVFICSYTNSGVGFSVGIREQIDAIGIEKAQTCSGGESWDIYQGRSLWGDVFRNIDQYPEYRAGIEKYCPEILGYHMDFTNMDDPDFVLNPVNTVNNNIHINPYGETAGLPDSKYVQMYTTFEGNTAYTLEENPLFTDPTSGDYTVKSGTDTDFRFEDIGRY